MIYNTAVKATETVTESTTSPLQFMLYLAESEGKMFDSLINIDFMDALNEADLSDQEEDYETGNGATQPDQDTMPDEKKKKTFIEVIKQIASKIWELLKKAGEAIANAFKAVGAKIGEIVGTNKGLVAKYGKYVTDSKYIADFPGIENWPGAGADLDKLIDLGLDSSEVMEKASLNECVNLVADLPEMNAEERKSTIEELNKRIADAQKELGKITEASNKTGTFKPSVEDMKILLNVLENSSELIKGVKESEKIALQTVDMARQSAKKQESSIESKARAGMDNDYATAWKDYYSALGIICRGLHVATQHSLAMVKQSIKLSRRGVIEVGKFAYDKARAERKSDAKEGKNANLPKEAQVNPQESAAFAQLLGLASDVYVESVFEM